MAKVSNPHKQFQFSIFLYGMNPFLAQKVTTPDREIDRSEHGEGNHKIKTAGMVNIGDLVVEKISSASLADNLLWGWISIIQNEYSGGGVIPDVYKKAVQVQRLATDGVTVLNTWNYTGVWPFKINGVELDRASSDNTIQTIEFSVDGEVYL